MRKIDRLLGDALEKGELIRAARAWRALRHWEEVVGPALATRSQPDRYERGTVFIATSGSAWASELRMKKDVILERLREISGDAALFEKLRFGVRSFVKPEAEIEAEKPPVQVTHEDLEGLSIKEIGERLLKKVEDAGRT